MAKYGSFKYGERKYGLGGVFVSQTIKFVWNIYNPVSKNIIFVWNIYKVSYQKIRIVWHLFSMIGLWNPRTKTASTDWTPRTKTK